MGCRRGRYTSVLINRICALGFHGGYHSQPCVISNDCTLACFHAVSIREQSISAVSVQRKSEVKRQARIVVHQPPQIPALELIILNLVHISLGSGKLDRICTGSCSGISGSSSRTGLCCFRCEQAAEYQRRDQNSQQNKCTCTAKQAFA